MFVWHQENKNTSSTSQRDVSLLKKNLVSRNGLRDIENIGARDVDVLMANFLLQVREFLLLICVEKTISMKILVLRVINSSRHKNSPAKWCEMASLGRETNQGFSCFVTNYDNSRENLTIHQEI